MIPKFSPITGRSPQSFPSSRLYYTLVRTFTNLFSILPISIRTKTSLTAIGGHGAYLPDRSLVLRHVHRAGCWKMPRRAICSASQPSVRAVISYFRAPHPIQRYSVIQGKCRL